MAFWNALFRRPTTTPQVWNPDPPSDSDARPLTIDTNNFELSDHEPAILSCFKGMVRDERRPTLPWHLQVVGGAGYDRSPQGWVRALHDRFDGLIPFCLTDASNASYLPAAYDAQRSKKDGSQSPEAFCAGLISYILWSCRVFEDERNRKLYAADMRRVLDRLGTVEYAACASLGTDATSISNHLAGASDWGIETCQSPVSEEPDIRLSTAIMLFVKNRSHPTAIAQLYGQGVPVEIAYEIVRRAAAACRETRKR